MVFLLIAMSCSDDSDSFTPSASDIMVNIDENPNNGQSIGTVATNLTGTLVYSISSQNPANAFAINSSTGEITINDSSKFNYEETVILEAIISVTNSEQNATSTVSVTLNDIDDIWYFLSSSRDAYLNAENDTWITVTENEYNQLSENLMQITKNGTSDDEFNTNSTFSNGSGNYTWFNDNGRTIPSNSYLIAFKLNSWSNNAASTQVKISTSESTGPYMAMGSVLPEYNSGNRYFVYKGANSATPNESYICVFASVAIGAKSLSSSIYRYANGNSDVLTNADGGFVILYQGLSTTVKQWD